MGPGTFLKESTRWENIIVKIILVLLCPRAQHEADVRQATRIIVIKLTRARQIIHLKMNTSRIVSPPKENGEPLWTGRFSIRPVNKNSLRHNRREGQSEAPRVSQEWRIIIPVGGNKDNPEDQDTRNQAQNMDRGWAKRVPTRITYYKDW